MSSIRDILAKKQYDEPPEIKIIKDYVRDKFKSKVSIAVTANQIIIACPNAALAGTLRLHSYQLAEVCKTDKRLIIRIG